MAGRVVNAINTAKGFACSIALLCASMNVFAADPFIAGSVPDVNASEDSGPIVVDLTGLFDDPDLPSDTLTISIDDVDGDNLFDNVSVAGPTLTLDLTENAFGSATIDITVEDQDGNSPDDPYELNVTINPVNDDAEALDDSFTLNEDSGFTVLSVLDNDKGDPDLQITGVGTSDTFYAVDPSGLVQSFNKADIILSGGSIFFQPAENFWGEVNFTYTMEDEDGQVSSGNVLVTVVEQNDAPEAVNRDYTVAEASELETTVDNGLLQGAFDVDGSISDASGNPLIPQQNLSVVISSFPDPTKGTLVSVTSDGAFVFRAAPGVINENVTFTYQVFDNDDLSAVATVTIFVEGNPPPPTPPNPGEVGSFYNLANTPLEQGSTVEPNVIITMDDSGSMDWSVVVPGTDVVRLDNSPVATRWRRAFYYYYLWPLPGRYSGWWVLPTQESLPFGTGYNVWRYWNHNHNPIYYNPSVRYLPWKGVDSSGNAFANANPSSIRLAPQNTGSTYNILSPKSYGVYIPRWSWWGGYQWIWVNNYYIPRYYTDAGALVEIRSGSNYTGSDDRTDCANPNSCTYAEEIQNFANWFQYYRSRDLVAKAATGNVVADLQDIRVGYETLNRKRYEPIAPMNDFPWEGEKQQLLHDVYNSVPWGGTPLRRALDDAGRIMSCNYSGRPCPALPAPEGICQQNFNLLFTDGIWNSAGATVSGNYDINGAGIFDGGRYADSVGGTLADVAMYYYENDIRPGTPDAVPPLQIDYDSLPDGVLAEDALLHQHMKTYVISFGVTGGRDVESTLATPPATPIAWANPFGSINARIDDVLHATMNGRGRYLNAGNPQELQTAIESAFLEFTQSASSSSAATFNSTSLREGTLLYRGFYDLRNRKGELTATEVDTAGVIASAPTWSAAGLLDGVAYASRTIVSWDDVAKDGVAFNHGDLNTNQKALFTADQINFLRGDRSNEAPGGSLRERFSVGGLLGDIVNSSPVFVGAPRAVNRDQAPFNTSSLYSNFASSNYNRKQMVYVGANDGMLHGFNAATGVEEFAFVPNAILDLNVRDTNKLDVFTSTFYLHEYFVDLTPSLNDVFMSNTTGGTRAWRTTLVGGLGAGGKGYFALDVTDPANQFANVTSAAGTVLWEFTIEDDTYPSNPDGSPLGGAVDAITDGSGRPVRDLGYAMTAPTITMTNSVAGGDNEWVAIFGNGPNSTAGVATLFVLFMEKGLDGWSSADFRKISTGYGVPLPGEPQAGYPNGLGTPAAVDADLDGTVDYVYAGDRLGNLFRFDLTDSNPANWSSTRLFTAYHEVNGSNRTVQPILSKPLVVKHPEKPGFLVTFGTGSFITEDDAGNTDIQSVYTLWDDLTPTNPITAQANTRENRMVEQTLTNEVEDQGGVLRTRRVLTDLDVTYTAGLTGNYGWYIDLEAPRASATRSGAPNPDASGDAPPGAQFPGERAIRRFIHRNGTIVTTTVLPSTDEVSCFGARPGAVLVINLLTGGDAVEPIIDFNGDGEIDDGDLVGGVEDGASGGLLYGADGSDVTVDGQLVDLSVLSGTGDDDYLFVSGGNDTETYRIRSTVDAKTGRLSWTELED